MREDFMHWVWRNRKISRLDLRTTSGVGVQIINFGRYNTHSGPDFLQAQIRIDHLLWSGSVEMHLKSSAWYEHHHHLDDNYQNVILHVVWEHDVDIFNSDNQEVPVIELSPYVNPSDLYFYQYLMRPKSWIYCQEDIKSVPDKILENWKLRLLQDRLSEKSQWIARELALTHNNWEEVFYRMLLKNFGLHTNGQAFYKLSLLIPYAYLKKEAHIQEHLEALLLGGANLLDSEFQDTYLIGLSKDFLYLKNKYNLQLDPTLTLEYFKHRPDNFPSIRLMQFASLIYTHSHLFNGIIEAQSTSTLYDFFEVYASDYWDTHYTLDKTSKFKRKRISKGFIDLLLINTVIPFQYYFNKKTKNSSSDSISLYQQLASESNSIIEHFRALGISINHAGDSQALLQLKQKYCDKSACLRCAVGLYLLNKSENS